MTIIVFKDGVLATDRRHITTQVGSAKQVYHHKKIFISNDRRLAFAMTGPTPTNEDAEGFLTVLSEFNRTAALKRKRETLLLHPKFFNLLGNKANKGHILFLTHRKVYVINLFEFMVNNNKKDADFAVYEGLPQNNPMILGSGEHYASAACMNGYSAIEAVEFAKRYDVWCGGQTDSLIQTSLKPFKLKGE